VRTVGVNLAAEPAGTAVASIEWLPGQATVTGLVIGADDRQVIDAVVDADKAGIDCPLGWPLPFVEFVVAHRDGHVTVPADVEGRRWRSALAYRATDEAVRQLTGLIPLSVAADRIAHPAMRCAGLLAQLAQHGHAIDRAGTGLLVEVHLAASLKAWNLPYRQYKRVPNVARLGQLVDAILAVVGWLRLSEFDSACRRSDDALDAVVAALTARAAQLGRVTVPAAGQRDLATIEGWIAVPTSGLPNII
jgi:predicted nuclease with RNAse H fold